MDIKLIVGGVKTYRRTLAAKLHEIVGNAVLHAVGDKTRVLERFAIDGGVNRERAALVHDILPMELLHLLIEVVGIGGGELVDGLEYTQRRAKAEVRLIHYLFVALKRHHAAALHHILRAKRHQFITQHALQPLEGLSNHFKCLTHNCLNMYLLFHTA